MTDTGSFLILSLIPRLVPRTPSSQSDRSFNRLTPVRSNEVSTVRASRLGHRGWINIGDLRVRSLTRLWSLSIDSFKVRNEGKVGHSSSTGTLGDNDSPSATRTRISVARRRDRPNLPWSGCLFCPFNIILQEACKLLQASSCPLIVLSAFLKLG